MIKTLFVYSNYCMKCVNRTKWCELVKFSEKHHLLLEERRTNYGNNGKKNLKEAQTYSDLLPIFVLEDKYVELSEPLEHLL